MSDEDVDCYRTRYTDLNGIHPRKHFETIGQKEGRLKTCGIELTDI